MRAGTTSRTSCCRSARRSADRLERSDEAAGDRAARLSAGRGPRRRDAAVGSLLPRRTRHDARHVFPAHRRGPVEEARDADDDAARAVSASRSRAARARFAGSTRRRVAGAGAGARAPASARRSELLRRVRAHPRRHHREAVPRNRARGRRHGGGLHVREPAASGRHDAAQRRHRERGVDHCDRGGDFRHAGRQRVVRRRGAVRVRAIGAPLLSLHALREHHAPRRGAGGRDARRARSTTSDATSQDPSLDRDGRGASCWSSASFSTAAPPSASPTPSSASSRPSRAVPLEHLPSCAELQASSR